MCFRGHTKTFKSSRSFIIVSSVYARGSKIAHTESKCVTRRGLDHSREGHSPFCDMSLADRKTLELGATWEKGKTEAVCRDGWTVSSEIYESHRDNTKMKWLEEKSQIGYPMVFRPRFPESAIEKKMGGILFRTQHSQHKYTNIC